jgi:hypothetical protein
MSRLSSLQLIARRVEQLSRPWPFCIVLQNQNIAGGDKRMIVIVVVKGVIGTSR